MMEEDPNLSNQRIGNSHLGKGESGDSELADTTPRSVASDLYSNPTPSHLSLAGYGAPQLGQKTACSEILCAHSLHGFIFDPTKSMALGLAKRLKNSAVHA